MVWDVYGSSEMSIIFTSILNLYGKCMLFFFRQVSHRSFQTYHSPGFLFRCVKKHLLSKSSTLEASLYNCSTSSWKNSWCSNDNRNDVDLATRREKRLT